MAEMDVNQTTGDTFSKTQIEYSATQPQITEVTNHSAFYAVYPSYYFTFANRWLRRWLGWFDGYVQGVHGGGILSTRLATTLVYRLAEQVYGGGLLFSKKNNSPEAEKAVKFISGDFNDRCDFDNQVLKTFVLAGAGGTGYAKTNVDSDHEIWVDAWRADQCWVNIDFRGKPTRAKFIIATYTKTVPAESGDTERNFYLIEERFYATKKDVREFRKSHEEQLAKKTVNPLQEGQPYLKFTAYELTGTINNFTQGTGDGQPRRWEELPDEIKKSIIDAYGTVKLDEPKRLPFTDLGIDAFKWTSFISNLPQLPYGESVLAKIQTYLWEYDYMNSCMNTDFYLGRGRVLVPKQLQSPKVQGTSPNANQGLDNFLFTKVEYSTIEDKKPEAIQFELRSQEWINSRNNLLESMATAIGISPSTIASYLNDSSARTAREISSEESATALFIENRRKLFSKPLNDLIKRILLFYGLGDNVEVKFSQSGQTNTTLVVENTTAKFNAGLMSKYQAVKTLNPDFSEEEIQAELVRIKNEQKENQEQNNLFGGGFDEKLGAFEGEGEVDEDSEGQPELASPSAPGSEDADQGRD